MLGTTVHMAWRSNCASCQRDPDPAPAEYRVCAQTVWGARTGGSSWAQQATHCGRVLTSGDRVHCRHSGETTPGLVCPFPGTGVGKVPWPRMNCIGMQWTPLHWIPIHSIANAFHRNGIDTIPIDTYPFAVAVEGVFTRQGPVLSSSMGEVTPVAMAGFTARRGQANDDGMAPCERPFAAR